MAIKVGINGFGRIGRMVFRAVAKEAEFSDIEIVGINDLLEPDYLAYMLKYDSVHGNFKGDVAVEGSNLIVNGRKIRLTAVKDPAELKWNEIGADLVIDSTGLFLTKEGCEKHLAAGAKKVVQSAPSKDDTPMFVFGVNHTKYAGEKIVSAASCTTNCLAPVAKVLQRQLGHQARPDDHGACRDGDAEDRRRPVEQGLARRPRHPGKHHPVLHRRRQGRRRGDPGTQQEADRHVLPRADLRRVGGRPDRGTEQGSLLRRHLRGDEGRLAGRDEGHPRLYRREGRRHRFPWQPGTRRPSTPKPASRWIRPSSRSSPGTTTSTATPATCCASSSTWRAEDGGRTTGDRNMASFKRLSDFDLAGKRVFIRADLNVPVKDGKVTSDARITASMPTIECTASRPAPK
jgi:hypothetical protein